MRERKDFILVQLSEAGLQFAGEGGTIRVATARMHYLFTSAEPVEVLRRGEWPMLRSECDGEGKSLFEVYEVPAAVEPVANEGEES